MIRSPKTLPLIAKIYGFVAAETIHCSNSEERTLCHAFALNEHGGMIAYHASSTRDWARTDLRNRTDIYERMYPSGYEFFWVDPIEQLSEVQKMAEKITFPIWCRGVSEITTKHRVKLILHYDRMPNLEELFAKECC